MDKPGGIIPGGGMTGWELDGGGRARGDMSGGKEPPRPSTPKLRCTGNVP